MDKKNTTIGVLLLLAAFASFYFTSRPGPQTTPTGLPVAAAPTTPTTPATPTPATTTPAVPANDAAFAAVVSDNANATVTTLANDYVELRLTDFGGAISDVAFKKYPAAHGSTAPFVFNETHAAPILAFNGFPGLDQSTRFQLVSATPTEVVYRTIFENRIEVTRRYILPAANDASADPYRIRHETTFRNLTAQIAPLPNVVNLGTSALVSSNDAGLYLNVASYDGDKPTVIDRGELEGGGFLNWIGASKNPPKSVIEQAGKVEWATVKNQFFASIFTPEKPGTGIVVRRVELPPLAGTSHTNIGLTGAIRLDLPVLPANGTTSFAGDLYVGPKEYTRLAKFSHNEDKVMQYDRYFFNRIFFSGYVAPALNWLMNGMHSFVGNWGIAIILMTLLLKVVSLPFTLAASRSAKRMQKMQPLMQAVREKYKDNPQKMNQATMELFKEHKVNPMGGCLPVLITIPLFVGFYSMLQGTAELRFQGFLWAHDLSAPDTIGHIFGLPINIMPILMGATMLFQMRLTPSPSIDSAQAQVFKFMPFLFTMICYNFSCALALYSTINGLFTIGQQLVVNKYTQDATPTPLGVPSGTGKSGKPIKNVTPQKK
ncbi:MAG: membrane protein insertase YidC [Verrucomicrobia bacterium]|nr:membrane protein insertase YidC [Verrucomicrobiota bacterium]